MISMVFQHVKAYNALLNVICRHCSTVMTFSAAGVTTAPSRRSRGPWAGATSPGSRRASTVWRTACPSSGRRASSRGKWTQHASWRLPVPTPPRYSTCTRGRFVSIIFIELLMWSYILPRFSWGYFTPTLIISAWRDSALTFVCDAALR